MATHIKICLTVGFILFFVIAVMGESVTMGANIFKCFKFNIKEYLHCIILFFFSRRRPQMCSSKDLTSTRPPKQNYTVIIYNSHQIRIHLLFDTGYFRATDKENKPVCKRVFL